MRKILYTLLTVASLGAPFAASAATIIPRPGNNIGLVGLWTFDGGDFTNAGIVDKSGNGNTGYVVGGATTSAKVVGKLGQAVKLDGVDDYVDMGTNASIRVQYPFTVASWIKTPSISTYNTLITTASDPAQVDLGGANLQIDDTGHIICGASNGLTANQAKTVAPMPINTWIHVTCVDFGDDRQNVYIDGTSVSTTTDGSGNIVTVGYPSGGARMGDNSLLNPNFFPGALDDVRVYNRALSASEAKQLYEGGQSRSGASTATVQGSGIGLSKGLVGLWTFDGADVTDKVYDRSGQGNNGFYRNGATSSAKVVGKLGQGLSFDSNSDVYVGSPASLDNNQVTSISAWIKPSVGTDGGVIYAKISNGGESPVGPDFYYVDGDPSLWFANGFSVSNAAWYATNAITPGVWEHVVVVYDGSSSANDPLFYINGVLQPTVLFSGVRPVGVVVDDSAESASIGVYGADLGQANYFEGSMDDVRVYNRMLSASEVRQLYNLGSTKTAASSATLQNGTSLTTGLAGLWTFDGADVTNKVADKSGNNSSGYFEGIATSSAKVAGKLGQGAYLDGNSYIQLGTPSALDAGSAGTLAMWVNADPTMVTGCFYCGPLVSKMNLNDDHDGYTLIIHNGAYLLFLDDAIAHTYLTYPVTANKWQHVVANWDGTTVRLYVDGVEVSSEPQGGIVPTPAAIPAYIGKGFSYSNVYKGKLDDVRIYTRAITPAEVKLLYNMGR